MEKIRVDSSVFVAVNNPRMRKTARPADELPGRNMCRQITAHFLVGVVIFACRYLVYRQWVGTVRKSGK